MLISTIVLKLESTNKLIRLDNVIILMAMKTQNCQLSWYLYGILKHETASIPVKQRLMMYFSFFEVLTFLFLLFFVFY